MKFQKPISEAKLTALVGLFLIILFFILIANDKTPDATEAFNRGIRYAAIMCQEKGQFSPDGVSVYHCVMADDELIRGE